MQQQMQQQQQFMQQQQQQAGRPPKVGAPQTGMRSASPGGMRSASPGGMRSASPMNNSLGGRLSVGSASGPPSLPSGPRVAASFEDAVREQAAFYQSCEIVGAETQLKEKAGGGAGGGNIPWIPPQPIFDPFTGAILAVQPPMSMSGGSGPPKGSQKRWKRLQSEDITPYEPIDTRTALPPPSGLKKASSVPALDKQASSGVRPTRKRNARHVRFAL